MAQINLLKQSSVRPKFSAISPKIFVWVLCAAFIVLLGYYAWLFYSSVQDDKKILSAQQEISKDSQSSLSNPSRGELLTRQQQITNLTTLIASHVYWSQIIPTLASSTLSTATYTSMGLSGDGTIKLSANVPTLEDLDLYMQVFDLPQVNKYFSNIKISSFNKSDSGINFQVTMDYDPSLTKYQSP